jgi:hypothetical protein
MPGTREGFAKARATMIAKLGSEEAYLRMKREQGARGGKNGNSGGFASEKIGTDGLTGRQRAMIAGARGGRISRRSKPERADA